MLVSIGGVSRPRHNSQGRNVDYLKRTTLPASFLLHCVKHETENRRMWAFLVDEDNNDDEQGRMQWVVTDEKPEKVGRDASLDVVGGRLHVEIKVKEVFTDVGDLIRSRESITVSTRGSETGDLMCPSIVFDRSFS